MDLNKEILKLLEPPAPWYDRVLMHVRELCKTWRGTLVVVLAMLLLGLYLLTGGAVSQFLAD